MTLPHNNTTQVYLCRYTIGPGAESFLGWHDISIGTYPDIFLSLFSITQHILKKIYKKKSILTWWCCPLIPHHFLCLMTAVMSGKKQQTGADSCSDLRPSLVAPFQVASSLHSTINHKKNNNFPFLNIKHFGPLILIGKLSWLILPGPEPNKRLLLGGISNITF